MSFQSIDLASRGSLRRQRDCRLVECDCVALADSPLSAEKKAEWFAYRQALRDVPQNNANINSESEIVWPTKPA